jgi:hypothetical protein
MSSEGPTPPQAPETADDEIRDLVEFAAGIVADAERLCDRVAELESDDMKLPAVVDAADQLHMAARAAVRALTAVVEDIDAGWGERWLPR